MYLTRSKRVNPLLLAAVSVAVTAPLTALGQNPAAQARDAMPAFAALPLWDDGLSEMSYYRATDTLYGRQRDYVRVHMFNRQWMDAATGVKAAGSGLTGVPVFKLNIAEEIPTENYSYRYLTSLFLRRPDLTPFKMVVSSQEWCGTTFKHLRWTDQGVDIRSYSYFPDEGDAQWTRPPETVPFEGLFVLARAAAADGRAREVELLQSQRSTHQVVPTVGQMTLTPETRVHTIDVPFGRFEARRVTASGEGPPAWFDVEAKAPYRLLAFSAAAVTGRLIECERRAYWDRGKPSRFYRPGQAP